MKFSKKNGQNKLSVVIKFRYENDLSINNESKHKLE